MKLKQRRKSRYRRAENEIPADKVSLMGELSYPRDYIERDGKYMLTEKAFQRLLTLEPEAAEASAVGEPAGAGPVPEGNAAPAIPKVFHPTPSYYAPTPGGDVVPAENPPPEARFGTVPTTGAPEERRLKVLHKLPNPTMIIAVLDGPGETKYHVKVGNSANFVPGMPLYAVPHPQDPAFWRCVGGVPRYNGRW